MGSHKVRHDWSDLAAAAINNKSVTKTNILICRFSTRYIKLVTLRCQLRNSLGSVFWLQDHILFSRLWAGPSGLVPRVSCLIASSLSIIINFFCGPCRGLLFFYSSCPLQQGIWFMSYLSDLVVFPTFFNLNLNWAITSSWSKPLSVPSLVFATV